MFKYFALLSALVILSFNVGVSPIQANEPQPDQVTRISNDRPQDIQSPPIPDKLFFAGERVPLNDQDIRERLEKELLSNTFFHSKTLQVIKLANRWKAPVVKILKEQQVPTDFFYLAVAESALDNQAVSSAKARGMWQFLSEVGQSYGLEVNAYVDQRRDPYLATVAACKYLSEMKETFGTWTNSAAAYNRGKTGLGNALKEQKVDSYYDLYLNQETYRYVFRILAYKIIMEDPEAYGFNLQADDLYPRLKFKEVKIDSTIDDLPEFAAKYDITYKTLKKYNPWLDHNARYKLVVSPGKSYTLHIPVES